MRAIVIRESLAAGRLPLGLDARIAKSYDTSLDGEKQVEILEFDVCRDELLEVAKALAAALKPRLYYAHIWSQDMLYICFPHMLTFLPKGDAAACELAIRAGGLFDIPSSQMRFAEMFDTHHPDAGKG